MGNKKKNTEPRKELSEGQAITLAVLAIAGILTALIFAGQFLMDYFFPNF